MMKDPVNYKLYSALIICLVAVFALIIGTNVGCNNNRLYKEQKEVLLHKIDSLENKSKYQVFQMDSMSKSRIPTEKKMIERDRNIIKLTEKKDEEYKDILDDSASVDLIEFDRILTGLVEEYKIDQ